MQALSKLASQQKEAVWTALARPAAAVLANAPGKVGTIAKGVGMAYKGKDAYDFGKNVTTNAGGLGGVRQMRAARQGVVKDPNLLSSPRDLTKAGSQVLPSSIEATYFSMIELEKDLEHQKEASAHRKEASEYLKQTLGRGALTTLGTAGAIAGIHGAGKLKAKIETERIWKRLQRENPDLTSSPRDRENFEVVQKFSPDIASNITTARSYLQRAQQTNMAPHEFIKDLSSIDDARKRSGLGARLQDAAKSSFDSAAKSYRPGGGP